MMLSTFLGENGLDPIAHQDYQVAYARRSRLVDQYLLLAAAVSIGPKLKTFNTGPLTTLDGGTPEFIAVKQPKNFGILTISGNDVRGLLIGFTLSPTSGRR